jgi:hypothetical protein
MSELEMKDGVETEEFTDELSDEALDREPDRGRLFRYPCFGGICSRAGN